MDQHFLAFSQIRTKFGFTKLFYFEVRESTAQQEFMTIQGLYYIYVSVTTMDNAIKDESISILMVSICVKSRH